MKDVALTGNLKALLVIALVVAGSSAQLARAGESSVYLKSGWFTWDEKVNGSSFVKEKGAMHGAGITRNDILSGLSFAESAEVWGGNLAYNGHDLTGTSKIESDTSYLGSRVEVAVGAKHRAAKAVYCEPFVGIGHKFWIRTRSGEDWNSFYTKAGVAGEFKKAGGTLFVKLGGLVPLYTRNHANIASAGYTDIVTEPKSELSGFAEGGINLGAFAVSFEYEGMRFGQSAQVATSRLSSTQNGVVIQNNLADQPDSRSNLFSLKLAYRF